MTNQEKLDQKISKIPNEYYRKFFEKFKEIETLPIKDWRAVHCLAYFCKKYQQQYGVEYQFKFNVPQPSKSYELFRINSLGSNLSTDPVILKNYIDWIFAEQVKKLKKRFTSISFLNKEEFLSYYKRKYFSGNTNSLKRTTELPQEFLDVLQAEYPTLKTYGDLSFMQQAYNSGGFPEHTVRQWNDILSKLEQVGLKMETLSKLV